MIHVPDATVLAITKLRTRRVRTTITVVISGLLFSSLIAMLTVSQGALKSLGHFNAEGIGSRYIIKADAPPAILFNNPTVKARAQQIYDQTVADKKAAAKKIGITYDPTTEPLPVVSYPVPGGQAFTTLNSSAPSAEQAIAEYAQAHPVAGMSQLKAVAGKYHATNFYSDSPVQASNGTLLTMVNGQESFENTDTSGGYPGQNDPLLQNQLSIMSATLTKPFLLTDAKTKATAATNPDAIPVIVPYSVATKLLDLPDLPSNASAQQRLDRIKELYAKAGTVVTSACYRNEVSETQIQDAVTTAADIAKNAGNKDYQKPELIYGLPSATSCTAATVLSDTRTKAEKAYAAKLDSFNAEFGAVVSPDQQKLAFRIAGLEPNPPSGAPSHSAAGIFQSLVGSSLYGVIAIPQNLYNALPSMARYNSLLTTPPPTGYMITGSYYAEFASATSASNFIDKANCTPDKTGICSLPAKPFELGAFGSNSIALQDLQHKFSRVFSFAALAVIVIAIVIMAGTVGRMIADGRRETAVFRALGAKRLDIAGVYGLYTVLLSLLVAVFAVLSGLVIARCADQYMWRSTTVQAQLAFGGSRTSLQFHFFAYTAKIWLVAAAAIGSGLVSMVFPLVRNIRRNPIKDMRDE